jgi:predicted permease
MDAQRHDRTIPYCAATETKPSFRKGMTFSNVRKRARECGVIIAFGSLLVACLVPLFAFVIIFTNASWTERFRYWIALVVAHSIALLMIERLPDERNKRTSTVWENMVGLFFVGVNEWLSTCGFFGCCIIGACVVENWCDYWNDFLMIFAESPLVVPVGMVLVMPVFPLSIFGAAAVHYGALYMVTGLIGLMAGLIGRIVKKLKRTNQSEGMQKSDTGLRTHSPQLRPNSATESNLETPLLEITTARHSLSS